MNDKFTNKTSHDDEGIAQKLNQIAEQTHARSQFEADLEERLRRAYRPRPNWFAIPFAQISPTLRWVALMILLAVVLSWSIRSLIPAPQPANENTPVASPETMFTPAPNVLPDTNATPVQPDGGYDFRGAKLFLEVPLPESPQTAHVYMSNPDEPASPEQARALAAQFGIQGEMYLATDYIFNNDDYLVTDGKQSLVVHSNKYFVYTADMERSHDVHPAPSNPDAQRIIREFFSTHGFDFPFKVFASDYYLGYVVQPLAPDGIPMQYESYTTPMMRVTLDENGQVLVIDSSLMNYDSNALGEYGIITVQEAFDKLLDDTVVTGKMEFGHSPTNTPKEWYRTYEDNQPATVYGYVAIFPAVQPGKPAMLVMDGVPLLGNTSGMESLERNSFIGITGQYFVESGIRKFNVESWNRKLNEVWVSGILSQQGDQVIIISDDGGGKQYPIIDPPADLPLGSQTPENSLGISGVIEGDSLSWYYIQFFESNSGGGGGGGGGYGFYKLNLSGVPVPFPSPTAQPEAGASNQFTGIYTVQEGDTLAAIAQRLGTSIQTLHDLNGLTDENIIYIGQELRVPVPEPQEQPVQDMRGYLGISLHIKADGSSFKEYTLDVAQNGGGSAMYTMEGPGLNDLPDGYNGLPILVTGMINKEGKLVVDSYKMPYDNLQFQILKGTQHAAQLGGQNVLTFTTEDGQTYVEYLATNPFPADSFLAGIEGDLIEQEVLIIPDETFAGMPVAHVYQSAIFQENGTPMEVQSNRVYVNDESGDPGTEIEYKQPDLSIDKVELVYFVSNPYYQVNDPNYELRSKYIQPVWHFQGTDANGNSFDVVIQALKQEFLLPELAPNAGIG